MKSHSEGDASILSLPGTKGVQQCIDWLNTRAVVGIRKYGND
jgi:hypothetical protein